MAAKLRMTGIRPVPGMRISQRERGTTMRYTQPIITGNYSALAAIKGEKIPDVAEFGTTDYTNGPSYQADE